MDLCGWVNNPPAELGVDWDWLSGMSVGGLIPLRDHTTDSSLGKSPHTHLNNQQYIQYIKSIDWHSVYISI